MNGSGQQPERFSVSVALSRPNAACAWRGWTSSPAGWASARPKAISRLSRSCSSATCRARERDHQRDHQRDKVWPSAREEGDLALASTYRAFSSPSRRAELAEENERVEGALDELTAEQREVLVLAHVVSLSRAEIAAQLDETEGAVRATLHRALARVSALLEGERGSREAH